MALDFPAAAAADSPVIQAGAGIQIASLPAASAVARYYDARRNAPIWFKAGQGSETDVLQARAILLEARIELDTAEGRGTRFTVTLPLRLEIDPA